MTEEPESLSSQPLSPPPSALLWDVDGTLIDTTSLICEALDHIYRRWFHQTLPEEDLRALIGTPLKAQIRVFGEPEAFGVTEAQVMQDFIAYYEAGKDRERILTAVLAVLREGRQRGFPTGLVTSKNREELTNTLPRLGVADAVDVVVSADDVARPKPDPEGLQRALTTLSISRERWPEAVYIGDTVHDMQAARAAGLRGIAVAWGAATPERLQAENPVAICRSASALRRLLF